MKGITNFYGTKTSFKNFLVNVLKSYFLERKLCLGRMFKKERAIKKVITIKEQLFEDCMFPIKKKEKPFKRVLRTINPSK